MRDAVVAAAVEARSYGLFVYNRMLREYRVER